MRDRLVAKAVAAFYDVVSDLRDGLDEHGLSCEWCDEVLAAPDTAARTQCVQDWLRAVERPLVKGNAKYRNAVGSILSEAASVYHAIKYRDALAMEEADPFWSRLKCTASTAASPLVWDYLDEMTEEAYAAARRTPPRVPTSEEIAGDIAARRARGGRPPTGEAVLGNGAHDIMCGLCRARGAEAPDAEAFHRALDELVHTHGVTGDACRRRECGAAVVRVFPALSPLNETDWEGVTKMVALSTMERAIPGNMMRGIESVASQLVQDITAGRASMDALNIEDIGQRVLSGVSTQDVESFTQNIDKIIPAINSMGGDVARRE